MSKYIDTRGTGIVGLSTSSSGKPYKEARLYKLTCLSRAMGFLMS